MPSLFSYINYRQYLKDFYESKKEANPGYSYQVFAEKAGFKSKSYIIDIISGKKPFPRKHLLNISRTMGLRKKETEYFETLVNFNQAKNVEEKQFYYERLNTIAGKSSAMLLRENQYSYFAEWYHPVIRELVTMKSFNGNIKQLAKRIKPAITEKHAQESIDLLLNLGLLKKAPSGRYKQAESAIRTSDELKSLAIQMFQKRHLELADRALDSCPGDVRDISTLTGGISEECFRIIKKEIQIFRKHLVGIIDEDKGQDRVYQFNFQLFPLSELPEKD